jgi:ABC-type transport system involved in cytochrome bd biosynthesis fused ATPase/permease subunit
LIYETLFNLDCTVIFIAHRLSTIRQCDNIIVIDKNTVAEKGKHDELLSQNGIYKKIWSSQIGSEKLSKKVEAKPKPEIKEIPVNPDDEITYQ